MNLKRKIRNLMLWRYFANYFPIKLIKTVNIDPHRNYLFCSFPHGILATGISAAFGTNALDCDKLFPGLNFQIVTLDENFRYPFFRELLFLIGNNNYFIIFL